MRPLLLALAGALSLAAPLAAQLRGSVYAVDGRELSGVWVHESCGAARDSAVVGAGGDFSLAADCAGRAPSLSLIDPEGRYLPSMPRMRPRVGGGEPVFLLVPRDWTIGSGTHAGSVVDVDLRGATRPACAGCSAFYGREDTVHMHPPGIPIWLEHSLPLRVAFSEDDGVEVSEADSTAFMRVVESLEEDLGRPWFRASRMTDIMDGPVGDRLGSIIVGIDPALQTTGRGNWAAQGGEIVAGMVYLKSARVIRDPDNASVVAHELMHALGFGHTCSWPSVMAKESCPRFWTDAPTRDDVAHAQLLLRLRTLERKYGIYGTINAALAGMERYPNRPPPPVAASPDSVPPPSAPPPAP
jgi:hypothetical protein